MYLDYILILILLWFLSCIHISGAPDFIGWNKLAWSQSSPLMFLPEYQAAQNNVQNNVPIFVEGLLEMSVRISSIDSYNSGLTYFYFTRELFHLNLSDLSNFRLIPVIFYSYIYSLWVRFHVMIIRIMNGKIHLVLGYVMFHGKAF